MRYEDNNNDKNTIVKRCKVEKIRVKKIESHQSTLSDNKNRALVNSFIHFCTLLGPELRGEKTCMNPPKKKRTSIDNAFKIFNYENSQRQQHGRRTWRQHARKKK